MPAGCQPLGGTRLCLSGGNGLDDDKRTSFGERERERGRARTNSAKSKVIFRQTIGDVQLLTIGAKCLKRGKKKMIGHLRAIVFI